MAYDLGTALFFLQRLRFLPIPAQRALAGHTVRSCSNKAFPPCQLLSPLQHDHGCDTPCQCPGRRSSGPLASLPSNVDTDVPAIDTQDTAGNPASSVLGPQGSMLAESDLPALDRTQDGTNDEAQPMDMEGEVSQGGLPTQTPDTIRHREMPATPGGLRTPLSVPRPELGAPIGLLRAGLVPSNTTQVSVYETIQLNWHGLMHVSHYVKGTNST